MAINKSPESQAIISRARVDIGGGYVVLIPKSGGACHNSLEIGISNADPCYTAAVWDSSRSTFNSASSSQYVLTISEFEP